MGFLVRKIKVASWPDGKNTLFNSLNGLNADAFSDISTKNNELSWWYIESIEELPLIAAVLISTFKFKENNLKFICIEISEFDKKNILHVNTPENGNTILTKYKERHYDTKNMTYFTLGEISEMIALQTSQGNIKKIKWNQAMDIIKKDIEELNIDISLFEDAVRKDLGNV